MFSAVSTPPSFSRYGSRSGGLVQPSAGEEMRTLVPRGSVIVRVKTPRALVRAWAPTACQRLPTAR